MSKPSPARYRTTNWSSYNASLRKRGSLLIWVDTDMTWLAPRDGRPGRPAVFSNAAIQFCLSIKVLFKLPLRQTAGMVASLLRLAGLDWPVPDYSTLCRRQKTLMVQIPYPCRGPKALLAACGMLTGCEAEPSRKIARLAESLGGRSQDCDGRGNQRTYPRDCHQPPRHLIVLGTPGDLGIELADLRLEMGEGRDQHLERGDGIGRQTAFRIFHNGNQLRHVSRALRHDLSELAQMPAQGIDGLGSLPDQQLADAKDHCSALGLLALHRHEAHRRALRRLADCFGIGHVILLALHEWLHVGGWDQPHLMPDLPDLTPPEMGAATGFHRDNAGRKLSEECQDLVSSQLLAQHRPARSVGPVNLKHILRQIESDRDNLRHDRSPLWIIADPPWHTEAVGGRSQHQSPGHRGLAYRGAGDRGR